jgi:hypothetical protein
MRNLPAPGSGSAPQAHPCPRQPGQEKQERQILGSSAANVLIDCSADAADYTSTAGPART